MKNAMTTALLILALSLGSTVAHAQDKAPSSKGKQSEKAAKKAPAQEPPVTYLDLSGPPDGAESDLPAITKKGAL